MQTLSLLELNSLVREQLEMALPDSYWVQAELSSVHANANGHCYVELIQKDGKGNKLVAQARGIIWSNVYGMLKAYFEQTTGQPFAAGIKVLIEVTVSFHELYGYSLTIQDIDPAYTLGDMALRRRQILEQLTAEGVISLNKELPFPVLPQRVAVISSATAAGYGDFCNQLANNPYGFVFYTKLFPAIMQGENTEDSVLRALDDINRQLSLFDVVVIIRGGGAVSDLSGFDTYLLAAACAQFPLPIITGIGHERDNTVLDLVSHTRVKTPTAAAEFLIESVHAAALQLDDLVDRLRQGTAKRIQTEREYIGEKAKRIPTLALRLLSEAKIDLFTQRKNLQGCAFSFLERQRHRVALLKQQTSAASPQVQLARGYSFTLCEGRVVKDASELKPGAQLTTVLRKGTVDSIVQKVSPPNND